MRLSDEQVDELADSMEAFVQPPGTVSFQNHRLISTPDRVFGVMRAIPFPRADHVTACSFGLSHEDWSDRSFPDRVELVHSWKGEAMDNERLLVAVADAVISQHVLPKPGTIFENATRAAGLAGLAKRMPHALLLFPYLWKTEFQTCELFAGSPRGELSRTTVWFLQVVPIFAAEKAHIERMGFAAFEEIVAFDGATFTDLDRHSYCAT